MSALGHVSCAALRERIGDERRLVPDPTVVDLLPSAVGTDRCKANIQLGNKIRISAFYCADGLWRLDEHFARYGQLARVKPGSNASASLEIQRRRVCFASNNTRETFLVVCCYDESHVWRSLLDEGCE